MSGSRSPFGRLPTPQAVERGGEIDRDRPQDAIGTARQLDTALSRDAAQGRMGGREHDTVWIEPSGEGRQLGRHVSAQQAVDFLEDQGSACGIDRRRREAAAIDGGRQRSRRAFRSKRRMGPVGRGLR